MFDYDKYSQQMRMFWLFSLCDVIDLQNVNKSLGILLRQFVHFFDIPRYSNGFDHHYRQMMNSGPVTRLKLSMGPIRCPYSLYPRHVRALMLHKKETKYSYNVFQMTSQKSI